MAVVVTRDPGLWFDEVLRSIAAQDYPNLSVLVIDAGSGEDPTPAVAAAVPGAFVRRLEKKVGFGTAANEVMGIVEGASHYLFCHDDVVLAPDAVRMLVEEAFRSNAGIVSPKFVLWDDPERLLAVGLTTDKVGAVRSLVDRGELDQEQHDSVREILVAPSGATLVRADLFSALGGFDPVIDADGEDLDLCWRARLVGARIVVAPAARVRHLEATRQSLRRQPPAARAGAHRYRTLLTCYRWHNLVWIVPLAVLWALGEAATEAVRGRGGAATAVLRSLVDAVRRPGQLRQARRRVQRKRRAGDGALRALQVRGNARLRMFLQSRVDDVRSGFPHHLPVASGAVRADGGPPVPAARSSWRTDALIGLLVLMLLVFGTRSILGGGLPRLGTIPDTSSGWASLWSSWWSSWQPGFLGSAGPGSPAMALMGVLGTVLFGAVGTLRHVVVLGPLLVGPAGAYRAARHWSSRRGQIAAAVFYAVVPVPYNALARGHWPALVVLAATPWFLSVLIRLSNLVPAPVTSLGRVPGRLVGLAMLVAATASVAPSFLYVVPIVGLALMAGSTLAGRPVAALRAFGLTVGAAVIGFVLLLPWSATVLGSRAAVLGPTSGSAGQLGLGQILRFHTGPYGGGWWEWLLLAAAALPLLVGREWRLEWAARLWAVALVFFGLAWAGSRGWLPPLPVEVALAPAAAALAGSTALGVAAFELDLPGYRFGWRQAAAAAAGLCLLLAAVPFVVAAGGGRWDTPAGDVSSPLAFLPGHHAGDYRVLWVGSPDSLPLASRQLEPGMAYATSWDGLPSLADDWVAGDSGAAGQLSSDLRLVEHGLTTKLGHLLAPTGVRYLVIPNHLGPTGSGGPPVPVPSALVAGLGLQTDLHMLNVGDSDYYVYQNDAWAPVLNYLPTPAQSVAAQGSTAQRALGETDLAAARPALTSGPTPGRVAPGAVLFDGSTYSAGWRLQVPGHRLAPARAFGWAMSFRVPAGPGGQPEPAHLRYSGPFLVRGGDILQVILWGLAVVFAVRDLRRRHRSGAAPETSELEWFLPATPAAPRRTARTRAREAASAGAPEEVWTDV
ncbi:MAG TPA: glycosyltransferase [Acidimicrobiales bacterium]|nr:glycosyltransferase [Acidimicrobiales bacterium]